YSVTSVESLDAWPTHARKEDAGLLVYKDHLPVNRVVVGDTSRVGSEGKLTVGPLKCQGDRKCFSAFF
ncbi:Contactin-associated protein-like 2, partial [Ataeniobius toweri]|nr:Contactin-associated protein-like 2 [Ataeniobius toweri]